MPLQKRPKPSLSKSSLTVRADVSPTQLVLSFREIWTPRTLAQAEALNSTAEILLFGGAAGGLKTETLLMDAALEVLNPNLNAVIFRESFPQLQDIVRKSKKLYAGHPFYGRYRSQEHVWQFPRNLREIHDAFVRAQCSKAEIPAPIYENGATIRFGYLGSDADCDQHDGQEYSFIGFDESTHHTEYQIRYLLTRLRSPDPTLFCRLRLATNPGNIGHSWHKKVFIGEDCPHCKPDSPRARKPFAIYDDARFEDGTRVNHCTQFIPARIDDHNLFADPDRPEAGNAPYIRKLELQNPGRSKALREGCWNQFQGQYFTCWDETRGREVPDDYKGPDMRMVIPFAEAPVEWWYPHFTGTDWGVGSSQAASYLCARTPADKHFPTGRVYVLKEWCEAESDIDRYPAEFIKRFVGDIRNSWEENNRAKIVACYLGPDSWANRGDGHTIAGQFQDRIGEYGLTLTKASTDREGGWQLIYRMLKSGELVICGDTCPNLVKAIPTRIHDPKKPGDIVNTPGDHHSDEVDALRYAIYTFITAADVHKPLEMRIAEAMQKHDPTMAMIRRQEILAEAEMEEMPTYYAPPSPRQFIRDFEAQLRRRGGRPNR